LKIGWLPLFDYVLAVPGIFFGFKATEIFAMIFPVILGVLSTLLVYFISKRLLNNEYFALFSALIFAVTPAVVYISALGFCDHHIWNIFLLLCSIYFLLRDDWLSLLSGVFMILLAFSWVGAPIYATLIALAALVYFNGKKVLITAVCIGVATVSFILKPFLGLAFLIIAAFLIIGYFVKRFESRKKYATIYYIALCALMVAIVYFLPFRELWFIKSGIDYLFGRSMYLPTIVEARPFKFMEIMYILGIFVSFLAMASVLLYRNRFVLTLFVSALLLAILQIRFTEVLAIPVSLYASYTLCVLLDLHEIGHSVKEEKAKSKLKERKKSKKKSNKITKKDNEITLSDKILVLGGICFILLPSFIVAIRPFDMNESWKNALLWIHENTEKTSYYLHPDKKPEYSILSWWDYGNWIVYVAKRPVVCNNFQAGAIDAAKFFTAQSEDEALKIIKKRRVRYIITDDKMRLNKKFRAIMRIAGMNPDALGLNKTLKIYNNSIFYKLHFENAVNLTHFKLLKDFGDVKIFVVR